MKTFNIYKKRDGQEYKLVGEIYATDFNQAKKDFAEGCYYDLLNGVHGDNYVELSEEEDGVEIDGVYIYDELFMAKSDLKEGIEWFSEDVYTWVIKQN